MVAEIGGSRSRIEVAHISQTQNPNIEEGKIVEPRFANPDYEPLISEEEEFANEDVFFNDCLFLRIKKIINKNFRESQYQIIRQAEVEKIQRKGRKKG